MKVIISLACPLGATRGGLKLVGALLDVRSGGCQVG